MQILDNKLFPEEILRRYEIYNYNHALEILSQAFPEEFFEIIHALRVFSISVSDITKAGGSESSIPPKFSSILSPLGWEESKISGDLVIHRIPRNSKNANMHDTENDRTKVIRNYIDGHNIDYLKGRVACDVEWNSKDQTYDRDLFAFRTYYECDLISVAVIITRSAQLNTVFRSLGKEVMAKYGASTTWMGKLLPRLDSRRHGGCPVLAFGITSEVISDDWVNNNGVKHV